MAALHDRFRGWDVQTDPLCLAISASRRAGHGDARLTTGEVDELREVLLQNPELFGLPFGAAPVEDITDLGGSTLVVWGQDLAGTSAIIVTAHARESTDHVTSPAGERPADVPRRLTIDGHFLPLVLPATPPRKSLAELLAPFDGRRLYAVWGRSGACASDYVSGSSYGGRLIEGLDVRGTINAYRGVLAIVHKSVDRSWIELRDVVHFVPVGTFHSEGSDHATFRCATTRDPMTNAQRFYSSSVPLGFIVDARTGEDLTDSSPPWTSLGWFEMDPYDPPDLLRDGFFASTLPWPSFEVPSQSPPG